MSRKLSLRARGYRFRWGKEERSRDAGTSEKDRRNSGTVGGEVSVSQRGERGKKGDSVLPKRRASDSSWRLV